MSLLKLSGWALLIVVGCNGKLSVNEGDGGSGGLAGAGAKAGADGGIAGARAGADGGIAGARAGADGGYAAAEAGRAGGIAGQAPVEAIAGNDQGGDSGISGYYGGGGTPCGVGCAGSGEVTAGSPSVVAGTGGVVIAPGPGIIGQPCIPGALVTEADGSPAKTVIKTLDRCDEGLACNAQSNCAPAPDCPSSGLCVFRRAALSGSGGAGGSSSQSEIGGTGGTWQTTYATDKNGVVALTASEERVYWLEYGTRDALGNYQHDGALMSYAIADGTTTLLASGLAGPVGLELTTSHAYVYIDGAPLIGTQIHPQLLRVPLAGGSPELVQDGTRPYTFAAAGSRAFWSTRDNKTYSMLSDANAAPTAFFPESLNGLTSDATDLFYAAGSEGTLMRMPIASAAPSAVGVSGLSAYGFALHEDGVFVLESVDVGGLLSRAPKSGGTFQRVRALGAGMPNNLKVSGNRYFLDVVPRVPVINGTFKTQVLTASFLSTDPPIRLLERRVRGIPADALWVGTANALYWSEGHVIYKQPLPTP